MGTKDLPNPRVEMISHHLWFRSPFLMNGAAKRSSTSYKSKNQSFLHTTSNNTEQINIIHTTSHNYSRLYRQIPYELFCLNRCFTAFHTGIVGVHFVFFLGAVFNAPNTWNSSIASRSPIRFRWRPRWRWIWDLLLWWLQRLETIPQMMVKTMVIDPMVESQKITLTSKNKEGKTFPYKLLWVFFFLA